MKSKGHGARGKGQGVRNKEIRDKEIRDKEIGNRKVVIWNYIWLNIVHKLFILIM
jgi:hypothetical protein